MTPTDTPANSPTPTRPAAPCARAQLPRPDPRARVITDEGRMVLGVVVRLLPGDAEAQARAAACAALQAHGGISGEDALGCLQQMHARVQPYRWVPRDDGLGMRPHLEDAEAGSRGSWLGIAWSYPV